MVGDMSKRDELHKDIEQLCMQQAGPSYLAVATKMHFQRTAGLEQEIENLKKRLAASTRDNQNLQEELSEAYRIKSQLADLHNAEVVKNVEAEKQVKFFQGCVASAFAERDHAIMEAEKATEKEELVSQKFNEMQKRLEELASECLEQKRLNDALLIDLAKQEEQNETFKKVSVSHISRSRTYNRLLRIYLNDKYIWSRKPVKCAFWMFYHTEHFFSSYTHLCVLCTVHIYVCMRPHTHTHGIQVILRFCRRCS
ncbi:hypothetical protein MANES_07G057925v8 [Manihot esculenta]|uniref:Uncharacterized protein n=2 Tax=Manihot esculenta TaxID=3983 RepID=A0ACB7HEZ3_MANES|nr:hypothetical protein MANES_07G057925v8 [Manihot esculenta]KAG8650559.1 hypothetical protein MANES_07G057925v8 [Manihot esculenta]